MAVIAQVYGPGFAKTAAEAVSLPCTELVHHFSLHPGARQVNKAKKEWRTWEWVITGEHQPGGEKEEG